MKNAHLEALLKHASTSVYLLQTWNLSVLPHFINPARLGQILADQTVFWALDKI